MYYTDLPGYFAYVRRFGYGKMTVLYLERRQEGKLTLGDLPRGKTRELSEAEIASLEEM